MKVRVYVEGGGDNNNALRRRCRQGFSTFFRKAGFGNAMPKVIACGSRRNAYQNFRTAVGNASDVDFIVLLVDSEDPVRATSVWQHLHDRDGWAQPPDTSDDSAHLMVQVMESWFLADKEALRGYFGRGFQETALPAHGNIEEIAKADVLTGLKNATRACATKSQYDKGQHSFEVLARLEPERVSERSSHAKRLLNTIRQTA